MALEFDEIAGRVVDGSIRYVVMRADVLMGAAKEIGSVDTFVKALERSAFTHGRASFEAYRARGEADANNFFEQAAAAAARLGWGEWSSDDPFAEKVVVRVGESPFAAGIGAAEQAVCGPITGILRALYQVSLGRDVRVAEICCAARGAPHCEFEISSAVAPTLSSG